MRSSSLQSGGIGLKFLLATAALVVIFAAMKAAQSLIAPFLLSVFFALILMPPLRWLKMKGLSNLVAMLVLAVLVTLIGLGVVAILGGSLSHFATKLPDYQTRLTEMIDQADRQINQRLSQMEGSLKKSLPSPPAFWETETKSDPESDLTSENESPQGPQFNALPDTPVPMPESDETPEAFSLKNIIPINAVIALVQQGAKDLMNLATVSLMIVVMVIFMLLEAAQMPAKVYAAFGTHDITNEYVKKIADDTWQYTRIKTIISFWTGLITALTLWVLGVEYAALWGLLMFFLNFIPNIGPIIASIPPILLALIDHGATSAIVVTLCLVTINFVIGYGIEPRWLGQGLGISDLVVLLSLIFWGWLIGPIGMFLSAPLTMVVKIVLQNSPRTKWIAVLLGDVPD